MLIYVNYGMRKLSLFIALLLFSSLVLSQEVTWNKRISKKIGFTIPDDVSSFLVSVEHINTDDDIYINEMISPLGKVLIRNNIGASSEKRIPPSVYTIFKSKVRVTYSSKGKFSVLVNNINGPLTSGRWIVSFSSKLKKQYKRSIFVNIHYIKKSNLKTYNLNVDVNADITNSSLSNIDLMSTLNKVRLFYSRYGVNIYFNINKKWNDLSLSLKGLEKRIDFLQKGKKNNLQLYLVKRQSRIKRDFQGLAGCLPIVIIEKTNQHCSVIIAYEVQANISLNKMVKTISHEIGHSLGLFHMSDNFYPFGVFLDPMSDTHEKVDHSNVMHKTSDFFGHIEFSLEQERYIKSNLVLQRGKAKKVFLEN